LTWSGQARGSWFGSLTASPTFCSGACLLGNKAVTAAQVAAPRAVASSAWARPPWSPDYPLALWCSCASGLGSRLCPAVAVRTDRRNCWGIGWRQRRTLLSQSLQPSCQTQVAAALSGRRSVAEPCPPRGGSSSLGAYAAAWVAATMPDGGVKVSATRRGLHRSSVLEESIRP